MIVRYSETFLLAPPEGLTSMVVFEKSQQLPHIPAVRGKQIGDFVLSRGLVSWCLFAGKGAPCVFLGLWKDINCRVEFTVRDFASIAWAFSLLCVSVFVVPVYSETSSCIWGLSCTDSFGTANRISIPHPLCNRIESPGFIPVATEPRPCNWASLPEKKMFLLCYSVRVPRMYICMCFAGALYKTNHTFLLHSVAV